MKASGVGLAPDAGQVSQGGDAGEGLAVLGDKVDGGILTREGLDGLLVGHVHELHQLVLQVLLADAGDLLGGQIHVLTREGDAGEILVDLVGILTADTVAEAHLPVIVDRRGLAVDRKEPSQVDLVAVLHHLVLELQSGLEVDAGLVDHHLIFLIVGAHEILTGHRLVGAHPGLGQRLTRLAVDAEAQLHVVGILALRVHGGDTQLHHVVGVEVDVPAHLLGLAVEAVDTAHLESEVQVAAVPAPVGVEEVLVGHLVEFHELFLGVALLGGTDDSHVGQVILVHLEGMVLTLGDLTVQGRRHVHEGDLPARGLLAGLTGQDLVDLLGVDDPVATLVGRLHGLGTQGKGGQQGGQHDQRDHQTNVLFHNVILLLDNGTSLWIVHITIIVSYFSGLSIRFS